MPEHVSEDDYDDEINNCFIEVTVALSTDVPVYTIASYKVDGAFNFTISCENSASAIAEKKPYRYDARPTDFRNLVNKSASSPSDGTESVLQFVSFDGDRTDAMVRSMSRLNGASVDTSSCISSLEAVDSGASWANQIARDFSSIPCYAPCTLIDTPDGPCAVETLQPGDLVMTLDHGPQAIRWVSRSDQLLEFEENVAKPVLISAGALGSGLPMQDLIVSPQHRILVGGHPQLRSRKEAFAPAKSLTSLPGIRHMNGKKEIMWIHFACDRGEVVSTNGCLSESPTLGAMVVDDLTIPKPQPSAGVLV